MVDDGMAKPMFCAGALPVLDEATAVFIPTTCPAESTSGPPGVPRVDGGVGLDHVLQRLARATASTSPACTVRPVAETMPEVTVGVPAESPGRCRWR